MDMNPHYNKSRSASKSSLTHLFLTEQKDKKIQKRHQSKELPQEETKLDESINKFYPLSKRHSRITIKGEASLNRDIDEHKETHNTKPNLFISYPNGLTFSDINLGLNQNTQSNGIQLQLTAQNSNNGNGNQNPFPNGNNNGGIINLINQLLNNQNVHEELVVQMKLLIEMLISEYNLFRQRALQNINNAQADQHYDNDIRTEFNNLILGPLEQMLNHVDELQQHHYGL